MSDNQEPRVPKPAKTLEMLEKENEELRAQLLTLTNENVFVRELLNAAGVIAPSSATITRQVAIFIAQQLKNKGN